MIATLIPNYVTTSLIGEREGNERVAQEAAVGFAAMPSALFCFLYVLLGFESYALLVGARALFVVLSVVVTVTQAAQRNEPQSA